MKAGPYRQGVVLLISLFYGIVICMNYRDHERLEPLRDPSFFSQVKVNPDTQTIEWPNGADLAPEFLHEKGTEVAQVA